jgi:hypothetical protein
MIAPGLIKIGLDLGLQNPGVHRPVPLRPDSKKAEWQLAALVGVVKELKIPEIPTGTQRNGTGSDAAKGKRGK